jgi:hypothetical protein
VWSVTLKDEYITSVLKQCSENHLHLRRVKQMSSLGHYMTESFVNYSGEILLLCYLNEGGYIGLGVWLDEGEQRSSCNILMGKPFLKTST